MTSFQLHSALQRAIPNLRNSIADNVRRAYSRDCWPVFQARYWEKEPESLPAIVVWPVSTEEVAAVFQFAARHQVPVTPLGSGSGVVGGGVPDEGAIVLDLKFLDKKLELDKESFCATGDVGWNGQVLEDTLNTEGFTGGHFPSSIMMSSLGGWFAARGAGQLSTRYGKFEDRALGCRWVYPDGSSEWIGRDGADEGVLELLAGSEGTLGAATEIEFRIDPFPESRMFAAYDFSSVKSAIYGMRSLLQAGVKPAAVRLYDPLDTLLHYGLRKGPKKEASDTSGGITTAREGRIQKVLQQAIKLSLSNAGAAQRLLESVARNSLLVLMFEGCRDAVTWQRNEADHLLRDLGKPLGEAPARAWFQHRYSITGKQLDVVKAGGFFDTMEVAFPWSRLHEGYQAVREALAGDVLLMAHFSHVYQDGGCIYFSFVGYRGNSSANERHYQEVWRQALDAVMRSGGTVTHHHGVGVLKAKWLADEWQGGYTYLRRLKQQIDPLRISNPGKLGL